MKLRTFLLVFVVAVAAYLPGFWNGFVYDDEVYVLANPLVSGKWQPGAILTSTYPPNRPDQGLYRPLVTFSYWVDHKLWGFARQDHWNGFHLTNALLHAVNACLMLALLRRLGWPGASAQFWSAILFAVHPALSESVAWISGRPELMSAAFGLAALLVFWRWPSPARFALAAALWLGALLCKEQAVMLPFLVFITWRVFPSRPPISRRAGWGLTALAALGLAGFWLLRLALIGSWKPTLAAYAGVVTPTTRLFTALAVLWKYILLWLMPAGLSVQHDIRPVEAPGLGLLMILAWGLALVLLWRMRTRFPWIAWAAGWFLLVMFPVSNLLVPIGTVCAERFLYLATLPLAPCLLNVLERAPFFRPHEKVVSRLFQGAVAVWTALLLGVLWLRLGDWRNNLALWESAARVAPNSLAVQAPLAEALLRSGRFAETHRLASEASLKLEHQPRLYQRLLGPRLSALDAAAQSGLHQMEWARRFTEANEASRNLKPREALLAYRQLIEEYPERPETREALGDLFIRLNNPVAARQQYEEALRLGANSARLFAKYGASLSEGGDKAGALMSYDLSLKANPLDPIVHYNRGVVLGELGDHGAALAAFREANRLSPQLAAPHLNAAAILIHLHDDEAARREIAQVLALDPNQREARELLQRIPVRKR